MAVPQFHQDKSSCISDPSRSLPVHFTISFVINWYTFFLRQARAAYSQRVEKNMFYKLLITQFSFIALYSHAFITSTKGLGGKEHKYGAKVKMFPKNKILKILNRL